MIARLKEAQESLGLSLKDDWLAQFARTLPASSSAQQQRDGLLAGFLSADLNKTGAGCLPADLQVIHGTLQLSTDCTSSLLQYRCRGN